MSAATSRISIAMPAFILWTLALFTVVCETLPVIMRDCASATWGS